MHSHTCVPLRAGVPCECDRSWCGCIRRKRWTHQSVDQSVWASTGRMLCQHKSTQLKTIMKLNVVHWYFSILFPNINLSLCLKFLFFLLARRNSRRGGYELSLASDFTHSIAAFPVLSFCIKDIHQRWLYHTYHTPQPTVPPIYLINNEKLSQKSAAQQVAVLSRTFMCSIMAKKSQNWCALWEMWFVVNTCLIRIRN